MTEYTFHWELRTMLAQFEDSFNDILIKRYNKDRVPKDQIRVNFRYSPKTRVLHEIVNKNEHFKLPVAAITVGGIRRDSTRVISKIEGSDWTHQSTKTPPEWQHLRQPVPVNVTVNMSVITRFQQDMDQILTNFIPYCDPYVVVSWKWPGVRIDGNPFEIRSKIIWSEEVSIDYPVELTPNQHYRIIADTSFTIEGWMFRNVPDPGKPIYIVDTSFTAVSDIDTFDVMKNWETVDNTDYFTDYTVISARPQFTVVSPFFTYLSSDTSFNLYGNMLDYTDNLYVSAADWTIFNTTSSDLSGGIEEVSVLSGTRFESMFPTFSGIRVPESKWRVNSQHHIILDNVATGVGFYDVIAVNEAGYGRLSQDCIRETTNPYPSSAPEFNTYVEYQYPCVSGIEIRSI